MASFVYNVGYLTDQSNINTFTPVSCTFKFYHYNTAKLSSLRNTTLDKQIVFDTDDADINNQANPFATGNTGLLFASTVINGTDHFAMIIITSTGADVYTGNMELKPSQNPTISINASSPPVCLINENIIVSSTSSDLYQWTYKGVTHYHKNTYYGITIFSKVNIIKTEYELCDANDNIIVPWTTSNIFNQSVSQYYKIKARCYNTYNQMAETFKLCFLYKHPITNTITHNPYNPTSNQDYIIDINIQTIDNNFINAKLVEIVNNIETEVKLFNILSTTYTTQKTKYQDTIYYKLYYTYNNGSSDITLAKTYNINMQLKPSILSIEAIIDSNENDNDGDTQYNIVPNIFYGDGEFVSLKYDLYFTTPFSQLETKVNTYMKTDIHDLIQSISFTQNGTYKVVGLLTDEFGGTSTDETILQITSDGLVVITKPKPLQNIIFDRE